MAEDVHFFKLNVNHSISIRFFRGDRDGIVMNPTTPVVEVEDKNLKVFKEVNKFAILQGLIVEIDEPVVSWETVNALTDEDIQGLLSNWLKLKNTLETLDSLPILYKIQEAAAEKGSSKKVTELIKTRITDITPEETSIERGDMAGSYDVGQIIQR